jgi:hypothetical protein
MSSIPKITLMMDNKSLTDLQYKILRRATKIQKLTEVKQINLENEWTEYMKNLQDYGNEHYLRSYALRLEMEVNGQHEFGVNI